VAEFPGAACVICIREGCLLTVEQYRYPVDRMSIEIPMGGLRPGEAPLAAAKRELREEAGWEAAAWEPLGEYVSLNGVSQMRMYTFVAEGLVESSQELDESERGLKARGIPLDEWHAMIRRGDITDGETLAAWMLYTATL
jgi:ADP-ribose pyrophosphatase